MRWTKKRYTDQRTHGGAALRASLRACTRALIELGRDRARLHLAVRRYDELIVESAQGVLLGRKLERVRGVGRLRCHRECRARFAVWRPSLRSLLGV